MLRHTDLCSGIGGFALGFEWAGLSKPVMFCDIEPWSRQVLAKHWPDVPIAEDVKELASDPARLVPDCDILTAGYPCQPFSQAGIRRGEKDDRHIWPEIFTIIQAKRPDWIVCENVYGHISLGIDKVLSDLEAEGYACQPFVVPACAVNAPHRRDRVWIVGYAAHNRCDRGASQAGRTGQTDQPDQPGFEIRGEPSGSGQDVADTDNKGLQGEIRDWQTGAQRTPHRHSAKCGSNVADTDSKRGLLRHTEWQDAEDAGQPPRCEKHGGWDFEPSVGRVANGISRRVDRLKGLGNAILPQIAMQIGLTIKAVENGTNN